MEIFNQSELPGDHDQVVLEEDKLTALLLPCPTDFDGWTSLIAKIEKTSPDDIEKISLVYDSFLSEFPLCYGYWKKFAGHKARLCTVGKVVEVYEQAVRSATYSVDLWVDYCSFSMLLFEDPVDIRRLFERGISFVGKDYLCHLLWDKYIEFEYSQKQWSFLAHIYLRTLKFPTRKLHNYYDSFKKLATIWEEQAEFYTNGVSELPSVALSNAGTRDITAYGDPEISVVIKDILNPALCLDRHSALQKYLFIGEEYYLKAGQIEAKIHCFESRIRRSYFHVKPLDISQLENWHQYLEFVEVQGDFDWTVKIYERCLIPCAGYPEFWMRYVNFVETWGGREIAVFALARAAQIYVKKVPEMHRFIAIFKEKIGDVCGSRAAYRHFDSNLGLDFIENVKREANLEKRQGNCARALNIYEKAIERAKEIQSSNILSILYVNFSRFKYTVTGNIDAARDVLINGIHLLPQSKLLLEGLINFEMMHRAPKHMNAIEKFIANAITAESSLSQSLSSKDLEDISNLYLEFVDHCGTVHDIMRAWDRHRKLFPHSMRSTFSPNILGRQYMNVGQPIHASEDNSHESVQNMLMLEQERSSHANPDTRHSGEAAIGEVQLDGNVIVEGRQRLESSEFAEKSRQDVMAQNLLTNELVHETLQDLEGNANEVPSEPDHEQIINMLPPSLKNLSLCSKGDENKDSTHTTSHGCETPQETPMSRRQENIDPTNGISSSSSLTHKQSSNSGESHFQKDYNHVDDLSSLQAQPHSQPLISTNIPSGPNAAAGGNWHQSSTTGQFPEVNCSIYPQTQQPQQWPIFPQMFMAQGYPSQPQSSQNPQLQPPNHAPNQYQGTAVQVQPVNVHVWPSQNIQQQNFASVPQTQPCSQPVPYHSAQLYPYMMQNSTQYGHLQGNQTYDPNIWQYYYQQQQQQQHQQIDPSQLQAWSNSYYQQQAYMQQFVTSQTGQAAYDQQVVGSQPQGQGIPQQSIQTTGVMTQAFPQQHPPMN